MRLSFFIGDEESVGQWSRAQMSLAGSFDVVLL